MTKHLLPAALGVAFLMSGAQAQGFNSTSTGALGPLAVTENMEIPLPTDGRLNYTTINVAQGFTVTFTRNAMNTPVYLLAQGDVIIRGNIVIDGSPGNNVRGGDGGPGGFDGGKPGIAGTPPGAGIGPGAGKPGEANGGANGAGGGSYGAVGTSSQSGNRGAVYGSPLCVPMVGGSGGGGVAGTGGGGGGGAIVIASSTRIDLNSPGGIYARGGRSGWGYGSGGAIRLVAPIVGGNGTLNADGGGFGGDGRIRIDTINRRNLQLNSNPAFSLGSFMTVVPPVPARLDILEAAGQQIPDGATAPVVVQLPFGSSANRTVTVRARDFNASVPIEVVLTPDSGAPVTYTATIDNVANNPATAVVQVVVPANTLVTVQAFTR